MFFSRDNHLYALLLYFQVKVVDEKAFKQVVEEEIRKLDRQENEAMPQVTLSRNNVSVSNSNKIVKHHHTQILCSTYVCLILNQKFLING